MAGRIGIRLKALREFYGWSQRELAKRSGVPNSAISVIEQGNVSPSVVSLEKVLNGFPVSLSDFFSIDIARQKVHQHPRQLTPNVQPPTAGLQLEARAEGAGFNLRVYHLDTEDPSLNLMARDRSMVLVLEGEAVFSSLSFNQSLQRGDCLTLLTPTPFRLKPLKGPVTWIVAARNAS